MGASSSKIISKNVNEILRERVVNILAVNSTNLSNLVTVSQNMNISIKCDGNATFNCPVTQDIIANMKFITRITQSQTEAIRSILEAETSNKNSQTMAMVLGVLSGAGEWRTTELSNEFINRVTNIVKENITTENITRVINQQKYSQDMKLELNFGGNCNISGDQCKFLQSITLNTSAETILSNIIKLSSDDGVVTRIINDNKQDTQIEARGLDDLVKALTAWVGIFGVVAAFGAFIALKSGSSVVPTETLTEVAKKKPVFAILASLVFLIIIIGMIYLIVAYFKGLWPFAGIRKLWKCEFVDGKHTGKCIEGVFDRGFKTRQECESSKTCDQYWGCEKVNGEFTGKCKEYTNAVDGPKRTKEECEAAISNNEMCTYGYGCERDNNGLFTSPPKCIQYKDPSLGQWKTQNICGENSGSQCKNKWKCFNGGCSMVDSRSEWAMFETEGDCRSVCKKN